MQFNFNFEAFEQSGKEKNEAINYLKSLNSSIDFDKLEQENKGDENAIYEALKGGNFSFSKPSIEQTRQKLLKNKENEALKAEFSAATSWLGEDKKQDYNFYDFKKAKEKANSKQGLTQADLKEKEKQMQKKEALFETRLKERGIIAKSFDDMLDQSGAYLGADLLEKGLNKLGFKDENYIFESEKEDIKSRALKSVREKLERGDLEFNEREKHALRSKYDELDYKKALEKEKERLRLSQKSGNFSEAEREFIENDLGFFNTLFNDDKENIKEFKEKVKSEGVISSEIIKAANTLKAFDEGNLFKNMLFADEKEKKEFQQNFLNDAYKIAELSGFDDVGLDKKGELYFIKDEQKYLVNTGFFDNFAQLLNDTKFEFAGGVLGGMKGFNSGKSAKGKVAKSILGAAAGSFGGAFLDAKIADMYLNRESDFKKNLDFAIQAGLLSMAGDGVILSVKPLAKGLYKGVKKGGEILGEYSILGTLKTLPEQNIQAAEKIINEVFSPKMKEELKAAQEEFGGSVRGEDLKNAFFANLQKKFTQKYGENDSKTKSVAKIAEIFNTNSLKTRQQAMLDLVRSDKDGSTLAYLLEIAKDDVKIQSNLKNMLNLASSNVEKNLKNLNINAREIKHILDEFEAGNKAAFKEVESQISKLYDENYRVVLSKGEYENIKEEFRQNGVNLEEMTPFLRDLEANVFNENGVTFTQLNNFRKNLNFYIYNRDKTPNFINTLKKIGENILKNEIDKGIDNIFSQNKAAYESIKELYSTSLKDYATLKSLNESIKNLKLQDSAKSADEVLNSLIKYAKGQGEKGVNNLQKIKDYLGEENNAFLEMQILNKLFKESVVENDRASLRVFDSEGFLGRVRELVGDTPAKYALNKDEAKLFLENLNGAKIPKKLDIEGFLKELESVENKENFISHLRKKEDAQSRLAYLNLVEPTLKEADLILHNGKRQDYIKKFNDGKDFFTLLITEENGKRLITFLPKTREDFIKNKIDNASLIQSFTSRASKQGNGLANESITQPLFKSKEAREFLELVEGFHKLYKNDASIAKNLAQGTSEKLSTSIATSAEGAIKQKVVKGAFDPIFRLLPDKILFGLFAKQIQGGALRYHLKKALSRSLNYDDFKIKLEKELKRTNFNSNTSRLIDEFMQNLDTFNAEKEAKLAKIREEQARIKEEERKRAEEIYQAQEANNLKDILEAEEKPLKDEFGVNFEGFKGKEAIEKLLEEKRGQVKGAFYKEGLGEIDLVWGEITDLEKHKGYGLAHILDKRKSEFVEQGASQSEAAQKAAEFAKNEISNIMQNGKIINKANEATRIETQDYRLILKQNWKGEPTKNKWLVTAYMKKEKGESISSSPFTKEDNLSLNSKESIAQKALNLHEKLYLKDNDTPLNVEYKIVNKDDIKPSFTLSKTQFRSQKQEDLIKKIKENFNPDLLVNIRGDLKKGNPIITKEGEVISGNHRAAALKELEGENLSKYQNAVKEAFGVELKENEMLVRVADTSEAEIRRFSAASNEGLENNLGEQGVSLFAKYQDKIKALKEAKKPFVADDVYNLKYLVNKALGESSITKENDTSKALFASLARGRNNTILKALNELEKENLEQVSKVANMFFDNAGAFYNLTHDLDLPKMQNLQNYFSDVLVSAAKADFTRAEDFVRLNEDIRAFLDSGDKNAMLKLSPNLVSDLLAKAMGAGFARFARLENPSASLYEFLNGLKKDLLEKGAPDLFSAAKGIKLNERDEFDFAKELILKGQDSEEKFRLYQNLEELKAWKSKSSLNQPTKELKHKMLERLKPLFNQEITTKDGFKGVFNLKSLSKMTSDKAIQKSVNNGFSKEEHLRAVLDIERLFKNANLAKTYNDEKGGKNVLIHRFNSEFENANALITTKESLDKDLNKIYTLELELTPRFSDEVRPTDTKSNTGGFNSQEHMADENIATIAKTDEQSIAQKAKNDEVLEAEVIEEVGLNEPMKFLEFQQRKLLTYIKENTPLRLLEHKKELKTRDILNFLEQSALNGKQKVFLMRNLERDFTKLKEDFKELESQSFKRDLLDKTKPLRKAEKEELTSEVLEQVQKENLKLYLNDTSGNLTKFLNAKKPFKITMRGANIKHILNRHGENSTLAKNGQPFVNLEDIKKYDEIINNADRQILKENDKGEKTLLSGKQINGHYIVISSVRLKNGELKLKTMYKENGKLENDKAFKSVKLPSETPSVLRGQSLTTDLDGYPSHADESIAQNAKSESEKEVLERQIPFIEAEIQKYEAKIASLDERIKKTQTRIQPYLDEINALQKQYDELYFTETRGEEANAKKWLKLEEIKAKQEELRKPYNDALFKFVFPYQRLKGKVQTEIQKLKFGLQDRSLRLEEIQNEALNTSKAQKAWLEAFNLKSLEEAYIPNFKAEVKEALKSVLNDEEIRLTKGSLIKLIKEKRLKYLDRIKPTLENPHSVILQNDGALIFARDYGEEKYFTSVARNDSGEWIIRSNAPKSKNGLNNKILNGGKEIYNDQAASQINASNPYDDIANSNIKLDNESIAQNSHYLELVKEYGEENAKRIIKQKILGENIAQVLENEEEKFIYKKGDREFEFKIKDAMGQFEMQYDELNLKSDLNKSFLKALNKLKIGYEVLENEPVRIRYFKQEAKERKPKETKPSANKTLGQIQKDMSARLKELKAQAKENYERYKNEDKALQKELTNTKDLFKAFEKEFNETEGTILISRAKRRKNDAEGKVETSVFLGNELALRNALDRWERYSGYSEENALEVKERLELLRSYVKRLEKHREDIKAKREQLEQDYQQNEAARSKEMGVIGNYNILSNLKGVSENELYEPFLEKVGGYLSKADFYERHLPFAREEFQKLFNITPLKEFGTNYAEFYRDGKGAVEKLLAEKQGQVSGAFYKEGLGEIDLVWGDEKIGLKKIIEKHLSDFENFEGKDEAEKMANALNEIIENGKIITENGINTLWLKKDDEYYLIGLSRGWSGKGENEWIITSYKKTKGKIPDELKGDTANLSAYSDEFNPLLTSKDEPLNSKDIIPQQKIKFAMEKFHYDENKAKDLLEWHKNSHALTKDENGLPKVFYHGTYSKFRVFRRVGKASQQGFFFTPSQKATEEYGDITLNTFLNIKNPFRADELKINKEADLQKWADILKLDYDKEKYESFKDLKTKLEKVKEATKKAGFKFHSASGGGVYVIDNKGRNSFINLEELDKENKRVVEAFKGLETEDIYFYYVVRNEFDLVLYALNKNDRYFHTSGRDEVKRVLEKLGYDGVVLNDTIITVFNSNQIKHIDNKGSFTDTKGNVTSKKPKDKEAEFSYFNEKSDNIYHSNPHLGAGLVGGVLNGVEQDENGNLSFDPVKFAMGFLGGAAGSKAVKESIKWRANKVKKAYPNIAKNNPTLMEQIAKRDLLTYAKNETQNALTRLLNKNKLFDSTKGLFAGEKALLNEAYAPHKARLEKAKELEGSGADEIEIWEKTGWYKDKDHKWKFEISQRGGELDLAKIKDKDSEAKLGEILKDDELFKAYPQLRDMSVKHVDLSGNYGFYYVPYNDIKLVRPHIQLDIDEIKTSPYKVKEVLYHEIQHAIQHKEQFAYGLSYMAETYERYLKQHGEVEARNIQERMKNPTKIHPHKTMDTDIEDTIAESTLSTEYSEAFSRKLEKSFLDESGRIAYKALIHKAEVLPQSLNLKGFKQMIFNNDKTKQLNAENALIKTPVGEVKVNVLRAFNHYMKNGKNGNHKENRQALNATFMPTLLEPKFVTRDEEGTMYYYKPFISKDKEYHITSIAVKKNGNLDYATSYNATENRLRQMIKHNELVYEKD
ncbi:PBECR2 nuclease fold domain-containing protein [Campylobacter upsaliensis]